MWKHKNVKSAARHENTRQVKMITYIFCVSTFDSRADAFDTTSAGKETSVLVKSPSGGASGNGTA